MLRHVIVGAGATVLGMHRPSFSLPTTQIVDVNVVLAVVASFPIGYALFLGRVMLLLGCAFVECYLALAVLVVACFGALLAEVWRASRAPRTIASLEPSSG